MSHPVTTTGSSLKPVISSRFITPPIPGYLPGSVISSAPIGSLGLPLLLLSFGQGVSSPGRLVERAAELGYTALALVDDNGVYGAVRAQSGRSRRVVNMALRC